MEPMTGSGDLKDELVEQRRKGDPRLNPNDRRIIDELTSTPELGEHLDAVTAYDTDLIGPKPSASGALDAR